MNEVAAGVAQFREFFREVNDGHDPFPWQENLVEHVLTNAAWPKTIDVPTGLGKTSLLDVAVFLLAMQAAAARTRIFLVVDRRLVVDEAHDHAETIRKLLNGAESGSPLSLVAQQLRRRSGTDNGEGNEPLVVQRMRGGTTWDANWVDRPDQPAIVTGTIDQIGSRVFFRGYGTTDWRKPIDAALTAIDSLILIDEAHLATAFTDSLEQAWAKDAPMIDHSEFGIPRAVVVRMSATPSGSLAEPTKGTPSDFSFDVEANMAHPMAARRLAAPKGLRLAKVVDHNKIAKTLATITIDLLKDRPGARALVVCNTVQRARAAREEIERTLKTSGLRLPDHPDHPGITPQSELLIGRSRPVDRERRAHEVRRRFGIDRARTDIKTVDVLVATQTVEVGANLDADVLVTESAPLDALTQRLGRLNRLGISELDPVAVVVHDGRDDLVYGNPRLAAWTYLSERLTSQRIAGAAETDLLQPGQLAVGPLALRSLLATAPAEATTQPVAAPAITRSLLDAWAQTGPIPDPDTAVAPYLHGRQDRDTDVLVCWRDDILEPNGQLLKNDRLNRLLSAVSPLASETVQLPIRSLRSWLLGGKDTDAADLDSITTPALDPGSGATVVVYRAEAWHAVDAGRIRPGEIVVVPAQRGGLDAFGWNPASRETVSDVWESATFGRGRIAIRLDDQTLGRILTSDARITAPEAVDETTAALDVLWKTPGSDADNEVIERLKALVAARLLKAPYADIIARLEGAEVLTIDEDKHHKALLVVRRQDTNATLGDDASELGSSSSLGKVSLDSHHQSVRRRAEVIARNVNLSSLLIAVVAEAAGSHDLGKLDARFQASLYGGDLMAVLAAETPLAKSGADPRSTAARRARRLARVPRGFRHEAWSARLVSQTASRWSDPRLNDLFIHLVASHHGRSRPLLPIVIDDDPQKLTHNGMTTTTGSAASVDFESPRRFHTLNTWLGRWGLAYLETIVRCADQTCSKEGM